MLWTGIFSLAHQYFINSFITSETISQECTFNQGLVTTEYTGDDLVPATTWPAARLVYDAWLAASSNGGVMGIYDKIDSDYSNFKPAKKDLLGYWNCTEAAGSTISPADWVSTDALDNWIGNQSFTYPIWHQEGSALLDGTVSGFLAWSASGDTQGVQWSSRAIIATSLSGDSPVNTSNYQCDIVQFNKNWTMPWMPPQDTLDGWCGLAFGMLSDIEVANYGARLQDLLNGMVMITGSGNNAERALPSGQDTSYGCISTGTKVGPEIFLLLGTLLIVFLLLVVGDLYALISYHFHQNRSRVHEIPTDYISWQLAAVRNSGTDKIVTKDLAHYEYGWKEEKHALVFSKMGFDASQSFHPVTSSADLPSLK